MLPVALPEARAEAEAGSAELARELALPESAVSASSLTPIYERAAGGTPPGEADAPRIESIAGASVGRDRLLFRVRFHRPVVLEEDHFNLYLDLDNDRSTGRTDASHQGVDVMVAHGARGQRVTMPNRAYTSANTAARSAVSGQDLWVTLQLPEPTARPWELRLYTLSERQGGRSNVSPQDTLARLAGSTEEVDSLLASKRREAKPEVKQAKSTAVGEAVRKAFGLPEDIDAQLRLVHAWDPAAAKRSDWSATPERFEAAHLGGGRLLLRLQFSQEPDFRSMTNIVYLDLDNDRDTGRADESHRGTDVMAAIGDNKPSLRFHNPAYHAGNTQMRVYLDGRVLHMLIDTDLKEAGPEVRFVGYVLMHRGSGGGFTVPRQTIALPRRAGEAAPMPAAEVDQLNDAGGYRYRGEKVQLEALANKGLVRKQVRLTEGFAPGRARPDVPYYTEARAADRVGAVARRRVTVSLAEELGVDRPGTPIGFGFPLPEGALYGLGHIRVLDAQGAPVAAQVTATAFWPDDSIKWALIDLTTDLAANQQRDLTVEFGHEVQVQGERAESALGWEREGDRLMITTGPMRVAIDTRRFNVMDRVWVDRSGKATFGEPQLRLRGGAAGVELRDEAGELFSTAGVAPERVDIEQDGPRKLVVRVEGRYANAQGEAYQRYITRLTFYAGSQRVGVAHTHINDHLETEFTDVTSLTWPMALGAEVSRATVYASDGQGGPGEFEAVSGSRLSVFQADERTSRFEAGGESGGEASVHGASPGLFRLETARGAVTGVVHAFWQRWPKGLSVEGETVRIGLLPPQPGPGYGQDLPHYLRYPFVEGLYRSKWGMSFTERLTLDFAAQAEPAAVYADANRPVIAVVPAAWYVETGALGLLAAPQGDQFYLWDDFVAQSYAAHMQLKRQAREYGYFNYGDWYGERGRNWGNNEYDLAQNFFLQFARTGNRDYQRLALAAARHQADVDIVHAYPDPYYIGANHQHSIGHTGTWSQNAEFATWSHPYDSHTAAANGHTWADGMAMAWSLTGDARVMESVLALGEHIAWGMSRSFEELGSHERTAGWSLRALMAVYRATSDPVYLDAARRIAEVALREQDLAGSGAWPHALPAGHGGGRTDLRGNNLFLLGVLLGGLAAYHQETGDPATARAIVAGAEWMARSWDPVVGGWPYSALVDGSSVGDPFVRLNPLIVPGIAYAAVLKSDAELMAIAQQAMVSTFSFDNRHAMGKDVSIRMYFVPETLALLKRWYDEHDPEASSQLLGSDGKTFRAMLLKSPTPSGHAVRAPDRKVFHVRLGSSDASVVAVRTPHGAVPQRMPENTLVICDAHANELARQSFDPDTTRQLPLDLPGKVGDRFVVVIEDDQRAVWNIHGPGAQVVAQACAGFRIGKVGRARYTFFVPEQTEAFSVRVVGVHSGAYGAAAIAPDGKVSGHVAGMHAGEALLPSAKDALQPGDPSFPGRVLTIKPAPEQTGKFWQLVLWAQGDIGCELVGVPPVLAVSQEQWFEPEAAALERF